MDRLFRKPNKDGIVFTPQHIANLCIELLKVDKSDIILDSSMGYGIFLTEALQAKKVIGVEIDEEIFNKAEKNISLLYDNFKLLNGSSLEDDIINQYKNRATVAVINPPYSMSKKRGQEKLHELNFALTTLNALKQHGRFAIIAPVSCFIGKDKVTLAYKKQILEKHTLEAVISMPDQLFYPVGAVTAIGIFTAHVPHSGTKKTWFYSLKDDGFEITNKQRLDINSLWADKKSNLLELFENKTIIEGKSAYVTIKTEDEWIAEAHIEADYSKLCVSDFIKNLKELYAYEYLQA